MSAIISVTKKRKKKKTYNLIVIITSQSIHNVANNKSFSARYYI